MVPTLQRKGNDEDQKFNVRHSYDDEKNGNDMEDEKVKMVNQFLHGIAANNFGVLKDKAGEGVCTITDDENDLTADRGIGLEGTCYMRLRVRR